MKQTDNTCSPMRAAVLAALIGMAVTNATASEMVYTPINPTFGGNPLYGNFLLSTAQATNKHKDPDAKSFDFNKTPLQEFNDMLQRAILNQLAYSATSSIIGDNGKLTPGTVETGNFRIEIVDIGGMLKITTTDKLTGQVTSFQVSQ